MRKQSLITLLLAIVILLGGAAFLIVNYSFPVAVAECGVSESFHIDENEAGRDLYWLTYIHIESKTYRTVQLSPEAIYSIGPSAFIVVTEYRARLTGQPLYYEAVFDYDDTCKLPDNPSSYIGGGVALSVDQ